MKNKRTGIVVLLILTSILILFGIQLIAKNNTIDKLPEDGVNINPKTQAYIVNGEELVAEIKSTEAYSSLSEDLYVFGKTAYRGYTLDNLEAMGFEVNKISQADNVLTLEGRFGSSSNKVVVQVTLLNKNRIKTSITDSKTLLNIDYFLPSNSKLNNFIGSLPIETIGYVIEYLEDSKTFTINVFNDPNNYQAAVSKIEESVGAEEFENINIIKYGTGDNDFDNGL